MTIGDYGVGAPGDDPRDYCPDCRAPWPLCRCADVDPLSLAEEHVLSALPDLMTAVTEAKTVDQAMKVFAWTEAMSRLFGELASDALVRADSLCGRGQES